jgi:hypothetical protein
MPDLNGRRSIRRASAHRASQEIGDMRGHADIPAASKWL